MLLEEQAAAAVVAPPPKEEPMVRVPLAGFQKGNMVLMVVLGHNFPKDRTIAHARRQALASCFLPTFGCASQCLARGRIY